VLMMEQTLDNEFCKQLGGGRIIYAITTPFAHIAGGNLRRRYLVPGLGLEPVILTYKRQCDRSTTRFCFIVLVAPPPTNVTTSVQKQNRLDIYDGPEIIPRLLKF